MISKKIRCFGVGNSKGHTPPIFSLSFCPSWEAVGPQNTCLMELRSSKTGISEIPWSLRMECVVSLRKGALPLTCVTASRASFCLPPRPPHYDSVVTTGDTTCFTHDYVPCYQNSVLHKVNVSKNCEKTVKLIPINKTTTILGITLKISKHAERHHNSEKNQSIEKCPEMTEML